MAINDEGSYIEGIKYDFVSNMLCSFHNEASRIRKLSFKSNLETADNTICTNKSNGRTMFY